MKKYIKLVDGKPVIKNINNIVIHVNGKQIINPTIEMILTDGWKEYDYQNVYPDTEQTVEDIKHKKIEEIQIYDKSNNVEVFYINDIPLWLNKDDRMTLQRRFEIEGKNGISESVLWKDGMKFVITISHAVMMLEQIELYAIQSFDVTQFHLSNVNNLKTKEEIEGYNYKVGYPEKLRFNIS